MDSHAALRNLPFAVVAPALGIDLKQFKLSKGEYVGGCPIHQSKSNKGCFRYAEDGKFHCFSCNAKGRGSIDLAMKVKNIGFQAAVDLLTPLVGQTHPETKKAAPEGNGEATEGIVKPLERDTWRKFAKDCEWLNKRVPDQKVRDLYGVFYYENNSRQSAFNRRVLIPVKDLEGKLWGYLGRWPGTENPSDSEVVPKYLFPKNLAKSRFLFGAHELTRPNSPNSGHLPLKVCYLVESPFAVMKFASLGLAAVSSYGWAVSEEQVALLAQLAKGCIFLPDRNKQDECAASCRALSRKLWLRFPELPSAIHDPEHLTLEQIQALTR